MNVEWEHLVRSVVGFASDEQGPVVVWCDASRPDRMKDLRQAGLDARPAPNERMAADSAIAAMLEGRHRAQLVIEPW